MINIGQVNNLRIVKEVDFGLYLDGQELGEILLPRSVEPDEWELDEFIDVFIYCDSEDRIIATTKTPYAMAGEFAYLKVIEPNSMGTFLDWGLPKDLLLPFREQRTRLRRGGYELVYIYLDKKSQRLVASSKLNKFISDRVDPSLKRGEKVDIIICNETDLGYKVIVENQYWGQIFNGEFFQELHRGDRGVAYINKIREDGKIDLSLQPLGYAKADSLSEMILECLNVADGFIGLTAKSSPDDIHQAFGVSKKAFKMAIGKLYKEKIIRIADDGIYLNED